MVQGTKIDAREMMARLAKLEMDMSFIKEKINHVGDDFLKEEMKAWEEASEEDILEWEKENL